MEPCSDLIYPVPPTGQNHRINLVDFDRQPDWPINRIFIYPTLDIIHLKRALERALSLWPIMCGHAEIVDAIKDTYSIVCSDRGIPYTYIENTELDQWPTDLPVVLSDSSKFRPYIDPVCNEILNSAPFLRIKITYLTRSKEYIFGVSFSHVIGDAKSAAMFLSNVSRLYQNLEPLITTPVFERRLLLKENSNSNILTRMKIFHEGISKEKIIEECRIENQTTDPITMFFSSKHVTQLRQQIHNVNSFISTNDLLNAYVIFRLNTHFFRSNENPIQRAYVTVNYRGLCPNICSLNQIGNCFIHILTEAFADPYALSSIAQMRRQSISKARDDSYLLSHLTTENFVFKEFKDKQLIGNWNRLENEVSINSQYKLDWVEQVDLGMTNQCRMHLSFTKKFTFFVFRSNPTRAIDGTWTRDEGAAEISFRIPRGTQKESFLQAWIDDMSEDFMNV